MPKYFTAGYQRSGIQGFIDLLKRVHCDTLYDIRSFPQSRNVPFNSDRLAMALQAAGIAYKWEPKLGGKIRHTTEVRKRHLPSEEEGNVVFMCFEKDIQDCHRKEIAELVKRRSLCEVQDLTTGKPDEKPIEQPTLF